MPFQCKRLGCGKGFANAPDYEVHRLLHTDYQPHRCEGCGESFQRMDALSRHRKRFRPFLPGASSTKYSPVLSEGGLLDCLKAQGVAQPGGSMDFTGLGTDPSAGSDAADSFLVPLPFPPVWGWEELTRGVIRRSGSPLPIHVVGRGLAKKGPF
jgi:hypothetical protein